MCVFLLHPPPSIDLKKKPSGPQQAPKKAKMAFGLDVDKGRPSPHRSVSLSAVLPSNPPSSGCIWGVEIVLGLGGDQPGDSPLQI